jgi:hypothetical protein
MEITAAEHDCGVGNEGGEGDTIPLQGVTEQGITAHSAQLAKAAFLCLAEVTLL